MNDPTASFTTLRHSAQEFFLTFLLLFGVATIVRWVIGPSAVSDALPGIQLKLLVVGVAVGLLVVALIMSPAGKRSGGHMNPAISFAMWRYGVFPGSAVAPYIVAQLAGSLLGVLAGRGVWGSVAGAPPVAHAALQPAPGWSATGLFLAETLSMGVIVLLVGLFLSIPRLGRFIPYLVGLLIALAIVLLGTSTGGSVNPARQFGPALAAGQYAFLWVYLLAPMLGALLAQPVRDLLLGHRQVVTHRLHGAHIHG
ncbi:MIP/aquaporin family protein [Streptomyces sp. NPDC052023]|uniref:MIP/aquaporin family protein n=1 Tax=Streptomyces sp. NPDC052023 TaxID=3365681 RepID=UPI0037D554B3